MSAFGRIMRAIGIVALQIAACLLALAALAATSFARADTAPRAAELALPFQVAWGEIALVEGQLNLRDEAGRYSISGDVQTLGPLNWISPFTANLAVQGRLEAQGRAPETVRVQSTNDEGERTATVRYASDLNSVAREVVGDDTDAEEERTPVDPAAIRDIRDGLSIFAGAIDQVRNSGGADCAHRGRIWDGIRLIDVWTETLGPGEAPNDRPWAYSGETLRCQLRFQRLGGFPTERTRWSSDEDEVLRIIHFAEFEGEWKPVRIEVSAPLGAVVARVRLPQTD